VVSVELLIPLAEMEGVLRVASIIPPQPDAVTSQGSALHRAPVWNARGFTGVGVKVGVIDTGFQGYGSLMGTELPASVVARCYTGLGSYTSNLVDCETGDVHGTAVAEAVVDVAPEVSLYIANPRSPLDLQNTAEWMWDQGVSVINHSVGWLWSGPGDGTSPFSESPLATVDLAVNQSVVWINSAGNSALDNWYGGFVDADTDQWHEFGVGLEVNKVHLSTGERIVALLRWDDSWSGASRDFDLYLYDTTGTVLLDFSENEQQGSEGQYPFEGINYVAPSSGTYSLAIRRFSGSVPSWLQLNTLTRQDLEISVASHSIGNPAESSNPGLLAVGAANWSNPSIIESFSSRGPTTDGRIKPDIVGADGGDSVTYGPGGFFGTSQSAPHVSGMAALVLQQFPGLSPPEIASYLKLNANPRGIVPNNTWGYGLAQLPLLVPGSPTGVTAVPGDGYATVTWSAPAADGGSSVTQYTATSSPGGKTVTTSSTSAVVTELTNGTSYTFTVAATNAIGTGSPSAPSNAVVPANLPPVVQAVMDFTTDEGTTLNRLVATFTDVDAADTHTAVVDWGDGATTNGTVIEPSSPGSVFGSHAYDENGVYSVTVSVTDSAGNSAQDTVVVTVINVAPSVDAGGDLVVSEGEKVSLAPATFDDNGTQDTHTVSIDWGDGSAPELGAVDQGTDSVSGSHAYADNGTYTVIVTATDDDGGSGSDSFNITVNNVAPVVKAGIDHAVGGGASLGLPLVTFSDVGSGETHTASIDWGDGSITVGTIHTFAQIVTGHHQYANAGSFTVFVTVTDDDGGTGSDSFELVVLSAPVLVSIPGIGLIGLMALGGVLGALVIAGIRRRVAVHQG
jgi:hypothetical protein